MARYIKSVFPSTSIANCNAYAEYMAHKYVNSVMQVHYFLVRNLPFWALKHSTFIGQGLRG